MYTPRVTSKALISQQTARSVAFALHGKQTRAPCLPIPRITCLEQPRRAGTVRTFSSTSRNALKDFFPPPESPSIRQTEAAWPHPVYTETEMNSIKVAHRETKTWSDYVALSMVRLFRWGMDFSTGYKHSHKVPKEAKKNEATKALEPVKFEMDESKWLVRLVFLESVAGVPGMVAGMLRHLRSLRSMKRDNGWIETLLEEAYNERMHLLTFLKMAEPGIFMRTMILGAQGVFFNGMFISYLISPRTCHRFVGYLEEEAVLTYTRIIEDIEAGKLPKWEKQSAPDIAIRYWNMPEGHRTMRDLMYYVRADEAKHREVNHTLGNLDQKSDPNPFVSQYRDSNRPRPSKDIKNIKSTGWEREEVI